MKTNKHNPFEFLYIHQENQHNFLLKIMVSRSTNFVFFTCLIFLPSIINLCEGFAISQCNGTMDECSTLMEEDEEFLMDTEEHRRILTGNTNIIYKSLQKPPICDPKHCEGLYNVRKDRGCVNYCNKGG